MGNILKKALNPLSGKGVLDPVGRKSNPFSAAYDANKEGGNVMNAIFDPSGKIMEQPLTEEEAAKYVAKQREKERPTGMKKGGKTSMRNCCRGMGAATRGGGYGRKK